MKNIKDLRELKEIQLVHGSTDVVAHIYTGSENFDTGYFTIKPGHCIISKKSTGEILAFYTGHIYNDYIYFFSLDIGSDTEEIIEYETTDSFDLSNECDGSAVITRDDLISIDNNYRMYKYIFRGGYLHYFNDAGGIMDWIMAIEHFSFNEQMKYICHYIEDECPIDVDGSIYADVPEEFEFVGGGEDENGDIFNISVKYYKTLRPGYYVKEDEVYIDEDSIQLVFLTPEDIEEFREMGVLPKRECCDN